MPRREYYAGLSLADAIERFVDFHSDPDTRHISVYEVELLMTTVDLLRLHAGGAAA